MYHGDWWTETCYGCVVSTSSCLKNYSAHFFFCNYPTCLVAQVKFETVGCSEVDNWSYTARL